MNRLYTKVEKVKNQRNKRKGAKRMPIKTYKGQLPMGEQEKIHLSTNNGMMGYKIKKFQVISKTPGVDADVAFVCTNISNRSNR